MSNENVKRDKRPFIFVFGALFFWWLIATSAFVVGTCIPEGRDCVLLKIRQPPAPVQLSVASPSPAATPAQTPQPPESQSRLRRVLDAITPSRRDALLLLSLIAALWVTKALVFPYEDLSKAPASAAAPAATPAPAPVAAPRVPAVPVTPTSSGT